MFTQSLATESAFESILRLNTSAFEEWNLPRAIEADTSSNANAWNVRTCDERFIVHKLWKRQVK